MCDIIGVGDTNVDLMIKVNKIPDRDEKVRGKLVGKFPGGLINNTCCSAKKFGTKTGIVTSVGDDEFGNICLDNLKKAGVNIQEVNINNNPTYFCFVHLDDSGEKALTIVETPNLTPEIKNINMNFINQAKYVHLSSLNHELVKYVVENSSEKVKISLDIESTAQKANLNDWKDILRNVDIVFINKEGSKTFIGDNTLEENAKILLKTGVEIVVSTLGSNGVELFTKKEYYKLSAHNDIIVKDTTGAGDCFNGVFLSGLVNKWDIKKCAEYANAAAAISIQEIGAQSSLPTREEIEKFLNYK